MSKHASIHYLQAVPTESQLRQPGHVAEHVWRQVFQLVVPQVQFLGQEIEVFMIFSWSVLKTLFFKLKFNGLAEGEGNLSKTADRAHQVFYLKLFNFQVYSYLSKQASEKLDVHSSLEARYLLCKNKMLFYIMKGSAVVYVLKI